jgi:dienelactone hydrolase
MAIKPSVASKGERAVTVTLWKLLSRRALPLRVTVSSAVACCALASVALAAPPQPSTASLPTNPSPATIDAPAAQRNASSLVEERSFIAIEIDGAVFHLETLIVKPANAAERLPIALIAHGKPPGLAMPLMRLDHYLPQARDLAYRGYLAAVVIRRGYGRSDGAPGVASLLQHVRCDAPDLTRAFNAEADDLEHALQVIAQRPDADGTRVIAIGESVGGASVLALAARRLPGLRAVVNISGGIQSYRANGSKCMDAEAMVPAMQNFGAAVKVPTLWVYSVNDSLFAPDLVVQMRNAFAKAGGRAKLVMLPPLQPDGHALFGVPRGRLQWLYNLDMFLRSEDLPTWNLARASAAAKAAGDGMVRMAVAAQYFSSFTPKVLVVDREKGLMNWMSDTTGLDSARNAALAACKKAGGQSCKVLVENFDVVANPGATAAADARIADR